jgi:hypothetical protein
MFRGPFSSAVGKFELSKDMMPVILKSDIAEAWEIAANIAFLLGMRVGMLRRRCGTMMGVDGEYV